MEFLVVLTFFAYFLWLINSKWQEITKIYNLFRLSSKTFLQVAFSHFVCIWEHSVQFPHFILRKKKYTTKRDYEELSNLFFDRTITFYFFPTSIYCWSERNVEEMKNDAMQWNVSHLPIWKGKIVIATNCISR